MNCKRVRLLLSQEPAQNRGELDRHLDRCRACGAFAERLERAREALRGHHAGAEPDPAFAARVVARLPRRAPTIGWAALRLLPITTALLLVLSAWVWLGTKPPSEMVASGPTDDLVGWVLQGASE